jgi:hypothetical protein
MPLALRRNAAPRRRNLGSHARQRAALAVQQRRGRVQQRVGRYHFLWRLIHTVAWLYPANPSDFQKLDAKHFIQNLRMLVPCGTCRRHFAAYLAGHPPKVQSGQAFFRWTVDLHNHVNRRNGKRRFSYEEARNAVQPVGSAQHFAQVRKFPLRDWIQQGILRNQMHRFR